MTSGLWSLFFFWLDHHTFFQRHTVILVACDPSTQPALQLVACAISFLDHQRAPSHSEHPLLIDPCGPVLLFQATGALVYPGHEPSSKQAFGGPVQFGDPGNPSVPGGRPIQEGDCNIEKPFCPQFLTLPPPPPPSPFCLRDAGSCPVDRWVVRHLLSLGGTPGPRAPPISVCPCTLHHIRMGLRVSSCTTQRLCLQSPRLRSRFCQTTKCPSAHPQASGKSVLHRGCGERGGWGEGGRHTHTQRERERVCVCVCVWEREARSP